MSEIINTTNEPQKPLFTMEGAILHVRDEGNLSERFGSADRTFIEGIFGDLMNISSRGGNIDVGAGNYAASIVSGIKPTDPIETMLATQMAGVHMAAVAFTKKLAAADNLMRRDSASKTLNQLTRTFVAQVEALKRYRTGGQQNVTVKHVTVNEGGQAIVGNVKSGGGSGR